MRLTGGTLLVTPRDVVDADACGHRTLVALRRAHDLPVLGDPEAGAPGQAVVRAGLVHEAAVTARLTSEVADAAPPGAGGTAVDLSSPTPDLAAWQALAARTLDLLREGGSPRGTDGRVALVVQGAVLQRSGPTVLVGRPDYLVATAGGWRVEDAKLARTPDPGAVLQTMLYREALASALAGSGVAVHDDVRLHLGDGTALDVPARTAAAWARTRLVALGDLLVDLRERGALRAEHHEVPRWCSTCHDDSPCGVARAGADHLGAVAMLRADQAGHLTAAGITTMAALAASEGDVPGLSGPVLAGLREQASLQVLARTTGTVPHRVREHPARIGPTEAMPGLWAVPDPDPGDVFFDIEGDPLWVPPGGPRSDAGLEYLLGATHDGDGFTAFWAHDRAGEARSFRAFVDWVEQRRAVHPRMHVLHYAPYEPAALLRLAARHDARADVVEAWLREGVLVDLFHAVRRGLRVGVASYSIKKVEALYGASHAAGVDQVETAMGSVDAYEAWRATGEGALLESIERYNRLDCDSTRDLRDHLLALRAGAVAAGELAAPAVDPAVPEPDAGREPSAKAVARALLRTELEEASAALLGGAEAGETALDAVAEARRVLAALLGYHVREEKAVWQDAFRAAGDVAVEGPAAAVDDPGVLGGLTFVGGEAGARGGFSWTFAAPVQEHRSEEGQALACVHGAPLPVTLSALEEDERALRAVVSMSGDGAAGGGWGVGTPPAVDALLPFAGITHEPLQRSLLALAEQVGPAGSLPAWREPGGPRAAGRALLAGLPHLGGPLAPALPGEGSVEHAVRLVREGDGDAGLVLAVQGPPGTGKSRLGTVVVDALLADARARGADVRIGVTANSHAVVTHLLGEIHRVTPAAVVRHKPRTRGAKKGKDPATWERLCADGCANPVLATGNLAGWAGADVLGGTAWAFSPADAPQLDVLVVDEAGQMGLGDVLAAARHARSIVLLGDPQQLAKPSRAQHPPGAATSALEHLMGEAATMPAGRGLFLGATWRMHADVASFVSDVSYEGRLLPAPVTAGRAVLPLGGAGGPAGGDPLSGTGLRWVPVEHAGAAQRSDAECAVVVDVVAALLARRWVSERGQAPVLPGDVLVVSPYNAQVRALRAVLDAAGLGDVPVGTVDRFQGQQGVAVVYSTASSDAASAPRGMGFLYDVHRLNVAVSRARCLAFWVGSPALLAPPVATLADVALADAHCSFVERAVRVDASLLRARP